MKESRTANGTTWNPFLNLVMSLKKEYQTVLRKEPTYEAIDRAKNKTCINRWLEELNSRYYHAAFSGVTLWQYKNMICAHYNERMTAYDEDRRPVAYEDFFKIHQGLYMECRGVVIDVEHNELVLAPFRKFMNLNESEETSIEQIRERMNTAQVIEFTNKLDGSMISAGVYDNEIILSSSSCNHPEVSDQIKTSWKFLSKADHYQKMLYDHRNETHIFELISPMDDPHIVHYEKDQQGLYLIGIRDKTTGRELPYQTVLERANEYGVKTTILYRKTLDQVLNELDEKSANEAEGFVLNIDGFKVKIKYNDYVLIHKMNRAAISSGAVIQAVHEGTFDDFLSKVPEEYKDNVIEQRAEILEFREIIKKRAHQYAEAVAGLPKKEAMIRIQANTPSAYRAFVRNIYLNNEESYLRKGTGQYRTMKELRELAETE